MSEVFWDSTSTHPVHPVLQVFVDGGFKTSRVLQSLDFPNQYPREPQVWESPAWYWVVITDQRSVFSDSLRVEKMRPYKWEQGLEDGATVTYYGWTDGQNVVANSYLPVHAYDDYLVVLCKLCDGNT